VARPSATTARKRYHQRIGNPIGVRFFSAVRTSEMVGLRWLVTDWNKRHMVISETVVTRERKDTKTTMARTVHLDSRAMDSLRAQHPLVKSLHSGNVFTLAVALNGGVAVEPENDTVFADLGNGTTWMDERALRQSSWDPWAQNAGHPVPAAQHRPPPPRDHTTDGSCLAGLCCEADGVCGRGVPDRPPKVARWSCNDPEQAKLERLVSSPTLPQKDETGT
jgi:hypothetical protein